MREGGSVSGSEVKERVGVGVKRGREDGEGVK